MRMDRREFLRAAAFGGASLSMAAFGWEAIPPLNVRRVKLGVGAETPFSVLHISDSHISRIDSRDGASLYEFAKARSRKGRELGEYYLDEAVHHARSKKLKIVHTGDFMEFMSEANLEYASRRICTDDILACVGNHEYWLDGDHRETEGYKRSTIPKLKESWRGLPTSSKIVNGVNFFVFDNAFETVTEKVGSAFEDVVKQGVPVVLVCHAPLWAEACIHKKNLCGMPGSKKSDAVTSEFVERVRREPLVKAILAGHVHRHLDFEFSAHARELVAGALFAGECTEVEFV